MVVLSWVGFLRHVAISVPLKEFGVSVLLVCERMKLFQRLGIRAASKAVRRHVANMRPGAPDSLLECLALANGN